MALAAPRDEAPPPQPSPAERGREGPAQREGGGDRRDVLARSLTLRDRLGFLAMVFGMFMAILDIQIVASSLAEIQAGLSASADEISWVQTAYLIAEVVMIPLSGVLARLLSTRVLFTVSALGFTAMSAACAFAWSLESMIAFRALQGFLGGAMIPTVFAASFTIFPAERHAAVSVVMGLVATMAPTLGPTLGGWLTEGLSWHWLFLVNLLPGLVVASAVWSLVDIDRPDWSLLRGFDGIGLALMALFLGSLQFVLEEGPREDWFADDLILALTGLSAAAAALFLWRVLAYARPIVELRAFRDRNFALGCLYSFMLGVGLYGSVYLMPLFLAQVRGYNALQIGLVMMVTGAFQFASAPLAGALSKVLDLRAMLALGLSLFGAGVWLQSSLTAEAAYWELFLPQAVRGISLMFCFVPINTLALGTLAPDQLKNASGLYNLMRNLGGAIGLAALNTVIDDRFALHWSRLAESVNAARPVVEGTLQSLAARLGDAIAGDPDQAALRIVADLVRREATVMTFNDAQLLLAAVFFAGLLFMPLVRKPRQAVEGGH